MRQEGRQDQEHPGGDSNDRTDVEAEVGVGPDRLRFGSCLEIHWHELSSVRLGLGEAVAC